MFPFPVYPTAQTLSSWTNWERNYPRSENNGAVALLVAQKIFQKLQPIHTSGDIEQQ